METKGRHDIDVPRKAVAANEWCKTASKSGAKWQYVFTPQDLMEKLTEGLYRTFSALAEEGFGG